MLSTHPGVLGALVAMVGLGFLALTFLLLRQAPESLPVGERAHSLHVTSRLLPHHDAVVLVKSGGKLAYLNRTARELFNVWEEHPNLESLARRTRPCEVFLALCVEEGQGQFALNGKFVEATSYFSGNNGNGASTGRTMLVSMRVPHLIVGEGAPVEPEVLKSSLEGGSQPDRPQGLDRALRMFSDLSQAISASLDLEHTIQNILEGVGKLIPSDLIEIGLWAQDQKTLVNYRLVGIPGSDCRIEKVEIQNGIGSHYSERVLQNRRPLLIQDADALPNTSSSKTDHPEPFFRSYLGIPLVISNELVGILELASLQGNRFLDWHCNLLNLLAGQAANALRNATTFTQTRQRVEQAAGLAGLAEALSSSSVPQDVYGNLVERIASLVKAEISGFLVYDESRGILEGQAPFHGIPSNVIEQWGQFYLDQGPAWENIWRSDDPIVVEEAPYDRAFQALGLHHLALAAGMRSAVLMPLKTGEGKAGYILVANKYDRDAFNESDLQLLSLIAGQAAPVVENISLIRQSHRRAQRAETLRRIASLTSSSATLDEILQFSILDLARLLQADTATLFLIDEKRGELRPHKGSLFGVPPQVAGRIGYVTMSDPRFVQTVTARKEQFLIWDAAEISSYPAIYQSLFTGLQVRSAIGVPLISRGRGIGELLVCSQRVHYFSHSDVQTVATATGQLASAIERSVLYSQTDQSLRQRVEQLTALTRISQELNTTLDLERLLQQVFDEAIRTTGADCGSMILFDYDESLSRIEPNSQALTSPEIRFHLG